MKKEYIDLELINCINKTKQDLIVATKNFETAENELIDYYTYQIKANKSKLDYLIKDVKKQGISLDMITEINIRLNSKKVV